MSYSSPLIAFLALVGLLLDQAIGTEIRTNPLPVSSPLSTASNLPDDLAEGVKEHPLMPVLRRAREGYDAIGQRIQDYTCTIIKRERRNGRLKPYESIAAKIRHGERGPDAKRPFAVYLDFKKPASVAGREVLYIAGRNADKMLVRRGGKRLAYMTTYLDPESPVAIQENRYPVTEIGFQNLIARLIEVIHEDLEHEECEVRFFSNAKLGDRVCTRIIVDHPVERDYFRYHRAVIFIDDQRQIPLAYASYRWPEEPGGKPILMEEYLYHNVRLNVGLTDTDFDRSNPEYGFLKREATLARE